MGRGSRTANDARSVPVLRPRRAAAGEAPAWAMERAMTDAERVGRLRAHLTLNDRLIAREERGEHVDAVLLCLGRDDGRTYVSVASRWVTDDTETCVAHGFRVELFAAPDGDRVLWWTEVSIGSFSTGEIEEHETADLAEALAYASATLATLRGRGADLGGDFTVEEIDEGVRTGTWG